MISRYSGRLFGEWFRVLLGGPFVAGEPVAGQLTSPGYEDYRIELEVKAIEPETYFSYTWHPYAVDPKVDYTKETPTLVEFRLNPSEGGTVLTVKESGFDKILSGRRAEALRMNTDGWTHQLKNIAAYVYKASH